MRMVSRVSRYVCRLALAGLVCGVLGAASGTAPGAQAAPPKPHHQPPHSQQSSAQEPQAQEPHTPHAHVYLLRGLFNVFSLGMDSLGEELNRKGVETTVDNYADWASLADRAAARYKAGTENPIILIGHSLGADAVLDMADYLRRRDVPVALVIPFDGTHALVAPSNVGRVVNLTQRAYAYVRPGPGFKGSFVNVDVSSDTSIDHITIDKAARTHARAISEVLAVVGHPMAAPKGPQAPGAAKPAAAEAAPSSESTGTTPSPADTGASKPEPSATIAPPEPSAAVAPSAAPAAAAPPVPPAAVAPSAPPAPVAPPAASATVAPPAPEPPRANEGSAAPPPPAHPLAQDANADNASSNKASPPPSVAPQAAPVSKPNPAKPRIKSSAPAIED